MTAVVIVNIVFAVFVVGGIVGLLGRAIVTDNPGARLPRRRPSTAKPATTKPASQRQGRAGRGALDFGG